MKRREFIKAAGVMGTASLLKPEMIFGAARQATGYFNLHPFVANHPEAVFVLVTDVAHMDAAQEKMQVGLDLGRQLFVASDEGGIPISSKIAVKPNLTTYSNRDARKFGMGIVTDANFIEGVIEGMKEVAGLDGGQFYLREGNFLGDSGSPTSAMDWYGPMTERTGAHLLDFDSGRLLTEVALANLEEGSEVVWREVPDGVIFQRIGYLAPMNADDSWNLNIAKLKSHGMGITTTAKNWQGTNVHPYIHYCSSVPSQFKRYPEVMDNDIHGDYRETVEALYSQHLEAGVPRWDRPGDIDNWNSGPGMEMWGQKTLDNHAATNPGLHIIEGIYAQNGNFVSGPGADGKPEFFMSNVVVFGQNPFKVDIVGHWLAGHEPGNFGIFHMARDRGMLNTVNPREIALYSWEGGEPVQAQLDGFARTPLLTYYMQRDYAGQNEEYWHMVDEPYEYGPPTAITEETGTRPQSFVLGQNYPNPFNSSTMIEFRLPQAGKARVEIYNARGQVVDVLVDGWHSAGSHMASWDAGQRASGTYFYRFMTEGFQETRKMLLVR